MQNPENLSQEVKEQILIKALRLILKSRQVSHAKNIAKEALLQTKSSPN